MKLSKKLPLAFAIVIGLVILPAAFGVFQLNDSLKTFRDEVLPAAKQETQMKEISLAFKTQVQEWKNVLLRGKNPEQLTKYWDAFTKEESLVQREASDMETRATSDAEKALIHKFIEAHQTLGKKYRDALEKFKNAEFSAEVGDTAVKGIDREASNLLNEASNLFSKKRDLTRETALNAATFASSLSIIALLVMTPVALFAGLFISRRIVNLIGGDPADVAHIASNIAAGNLTQDIPLKANDQTSLMYSMKEMNTSLTNIVNSVRGSTRTIVATSSQIAEGNLDLSARTEHQASSLEETASSMEELTSTVKQNADNAREANQLASSASNVAIKGGAVVSQVVDTMHAINASSRKIVDIISVIDSIAFQTNILALNAAVEAARAGEQGRGFAVVASEVRNLAQRSASAAKEIKTLINESVENVDIGTKLVADAGSTMSEIVSSVKHVTDIISEISVASNEQNQGIHQINIAVSEMDNGTQQNAALVEEAAAASSELQRQAEELLALVSVFQLHGDTSLHSMSSNVRKASVSNIKQFAQSSKVKRLRAE
ncbi:MAG: methyl-accepting chemotaxis protein [Burkholderiaceae bacterium]|nr:methyl-accepting chemotaxis protein [Burkholderiaceae bacterium]